MSRMKDFPRASFKKAMKLAETAYSLGGEASVETCADQMNMKVSGAFTSIISTAVKHGLIVNKKGNLESTALTKLIVNAYDENEKTTYMREAFFNMPLYSQIYEKFKSTKLPHEKFDKILIREFDVDEKQASRISGWFIEAAKSVNILNSDFSFYSEGESANDTSDETEIKSPEVKDSYVKDIASEVYSVTIKAPFLDVSINIKEEAHFDAVDKLLKVVKDSFVNLNKLNGTEDD